MNTTLETQRPAEASAQPDRLIDFRRVGELLGLRCKTAHTARALAKRGKIRAVHLNERVIRYSEASVLALIGTKPSAASSTAIPSSTSAPVE